jgi:hypothetical protein
MGKEKNQKINLGKSKSEKISKIAKIGSIGFELVDIIKLIFFIVIFSLITWFLISLGVPWYISIFFVVPFLIVFVLKIIGIKRMSSANLKSGDIKKENKKIKIYPNEKIRDYIAGIMSVSDDFNLKLRARGVLGVGEVIDSENAMIITDKRIIFITVPLPGADKIIGSVDIPMWQFLLAEEDVESKTKEIVSSLPLKDIISQHSNDFWIDFEQIKKVRIQKSSKIFSGLVKFITNENKKYVYALNDKKALEKIERIFKKYIKDDLSEDENS